MIYRSENKWKFRQTYLLIASIVAMGGCTAANSYNTPQQPLPLASLQAPFEIPLVVDPLPALVDVALVCREDRKFHLRGDKIQYCFNGKWQTAFYSSR